MRLKALLALALLLVGQAAFAQTTTISALPQGSSLSGTEAIPMDQIGGCTGNTCQTSPAAIAAYVKGGASLSAIGTQPIECYISHSYALRTISKAFVTSVVTGSAVAPSGQALINNNGQLGIAIGGGVIRLYGYGTPVDGYYVVPASVASTITAGTASITATNNFVANQAVSFYGSMGSITGLSASATYYVSATGLSSSAFQVSATVSGGVITPGGTGTATPVVGDAEIALTTTTIGSMANNTTYTPTTPGTTWVYDNSNDGAGTGINWLSVLRAATGNGFALPPSYVYGVNGGHIIATGSNVGDIGAAAYATAVLTQHASRLPRDCWWDLGVNDIATGSNLSTMEAAQLTGFQTLANAGVRNYVVPILGAAPGASSINAIGQFKRIRAYNFWLKEIAQTGLIQLVDPSKRMLDPSNATGFGLARDYDSSDTTLVHLNVNGSLDVAHAVMDKLGSQFPPVKSVSLTVADAYASGNNPTGSIAPLLSGNLVGVMTGTAALANVTASFVQVGNVGWITGFGTGSTSVTYQLQARTDTTPDGQVVPGSELVVTFPSGVAYNNIGIIFQLCSADITPSGSTYTAGDTLQVEAEVEADAATTTTGAPFLPSVGLQDQSAAQGSSYANMLVAGGAPQNSLTSYPIFGGTTYEPVTPAFQTHSDSVYVVPTVTLGANGTLSANQVFRIRGAIVRKLDPVNGEPFLVPPNLILRHLRAANDELCDEELDIACGMN